jgi:hypothetical protein
MRFIPSLLIAAVFATCCGTRYRPMAPPGAQANPAG